MMKWLIQDTMRNDQLILEEISALRQLGQRVCNLGYIPFTNEFTNLTDHLEDPYEPFCLRGSVKFVSMIDKASRVSDVLPKEYHGLFDDFFISLKTSIFYNAKRFSQVNLQHLPMLNKGDFLRYGEVLETRWDEDKFIKPSSDLKAFNAVVVPAGATLFDAVSMTTTSHVDDDELVLVSDTKMVDLELRLFVVEGQIVTGSQYHQRDRLVVKPLDQSPAHQHLLSFAREVIDEYEPATVYALDVCLHDGKPAIVEYNCFNASGLYKSDAKQLFGAVTEVYRGY